MLIINKIRHSLALRLMLLSLATLIGVALVFLIAIGFALRGQFNNSLLPHAQQYQQYIYNDIGSPPDLDRAQSLADRLSLDIYIQGTGINWSSENAPLQESNIEFKQHVIPNVYHAHDDRKFYLKKEQAGFTTTIVVKRSEKNLSIAWKLAALMGLLLVLVLSYIAIRHLFKPIDVIQSGVKRIGEGDLQYRIQIARQDELGELANCINAMSDDIEAMLDAKRTLLLAISHELRSPVTRSRVSLELLGDSKHKDNIKRDLIEVEILLQDLLEGERLSQKHIILDLSEVNINSLIKDLLQSYFLEAKVCVDIEKSLPTIHLDSVRIRLLLSNLINNAIRYNRTDKGTVNLRIRQFEDELLVEVRDHGEGIEEQHILHLTEAFYRVDPARQRKTGGYGLGLYLCNAIAKAHHGRLEVESSIGRGTVVRVLLPF